MKDPVISKILSKIVYAVIFWSLLIQFMDNTTKTVIYSAILSLFYTILDSIDTKLTKPVEELPNKIII